MNPCGRNFGSILVFILIDVLDDILVDILDALFLTLIVHANVDSPCGS